MYIALGQGQKTPWGQTLGGNRKAFSLFPFVANFKMISLRSDFMHIFKMILYMYMAPGKGRQTPGVKIIMSTEMPSDFDRLLQVLKKNPFELWFYTQYFMFFFSRVDSPGAATDNTLMSTFWSQRKGFITLTICCKFKKNLFQLRFYTYFWIILYTDIAPGQGQTNPFWCQQKSLILLTICFKL